MLPRRDVGLEDARKNSVIGSWLDCFDRRPFLILVEVVLGCSTEFFRLVARELGFELYTPDALHSHELSAFSIDSLVTSFPLISPLITCFSIPLVIFPL